MTLFSWISLVRKVLWFYCIFFLNMIFGLGGNELWNGLSSFMIPVNRNGL